MHKKKVAVLISTYNGEKYLREQLESVLNQSYKKIEIFVRDDGSTDNTLKILKEYKDSIHILSDNSNVGITNSFRKLLMASSGFDYYAFCDQDDVWLYDKIEIAVNKLNEIYTNDYPIMYASNYDYYDSSMNFVSHSPYNKRIPSFPKAIFETISPGMTMIFNNYARELMIDSLNNVSWLHDSWLTLICCGFGKVSYDNRVTVKYRRYNGTATGTRFGLKKIRWQIKRFVIGEYWNKLKKQLICFEKYYGNQLPVENLKLLKLFTSKKNIVRQIKKAIYPKRFKDSLNKEIILRLLFLTWRI